MSTYTSDVQCVPTEPDKQQWAENLLVSTKGDGDEHLYDKMVQFEWPLLLKAVQDKCIEHKTVFWTDQKLENLETGMQNNGLAFVPRYTAIGVCSSLDVLFSKDKHQSYVRIKRVPEEHLALREFCERVQKDLKLKLYYRGESAAVVGHNFVQAVLVRRRETITQALKDEL